WPVRSGGPEVDHVEYEATIVSNGCVWHSGALDLQIADAFQFRLEAWQIECVLLKFAAALYPEQEKMRGPSVGIGLRSTVAQFRSAIQDCVAGLHLDRGKGFVAEILAVRALTAHSRGADLKRPWQIIAISERQRHAVLA